MESRPAIPADIKRRVLLEAGHRCAIPTCRYIHTELHHIVPWERCLTHDYENLIALCPNCHARADRGDIDRKSLRAYKARLRFAHDKFSNVEMDTLFMLAALKPNYGLPWAANAEMMLYRIEDAGYIKFSKPGSARVSMMGIDTTPWIVTLTDRGSAFVASFSAASDQDPEGLA